MSGIKAVVAVDSFKGSLTSLEAGEAVKRGILRACPDADVTVLPLADGGEGTIDSIAPFICGIAIKCQIPMLKFGIIVDNSMEMD